MHHIAKIPDAELPTVTDDDGTERAATAQEFADRDLFRVATAPDGDGVYAVPCSDPCGGHPGVILASGFLNERHARTPGWLKPRILRARVYRATDGSSLRDRIERELDVGIEPLTPRRGRRPNRNRGRADEVLDRVRELAADEAEPVTVLHVPMVDVEDGDVVEDDLIYPVRIAGELSTR